MKSTIKIQPVTWFLYLVILIIAMIQLSSCGGKGGDPTPTTPSAQDAAKALLVGTWKLQGVMVDGVDKTSVYAGFGISFTNTAYSTTNGGAAWPATGTWSFANTDGTAIKRDDGLVIQIVPTQTSLIMTFAWSKTTLGGGRVESVSGQNVFTMAK